MQKVNNHGGNIYKAEQEYGIKKENILDFSANINPLGVPDSIKKAIIGNIDNLVNYPDPDCTDLKNSISHYLDIPVENVIIGNGASEVIFLLFNELKPNKVLIPSPTFSEYSKAAQSCGVDIEYFELKERDGYWLDIDKFCKQLTGDIDAVILCNPNNPTSKLLDKESLVKLLDYASSKNIYVIIDEAFIELTVGGNENSISACLNQFKNLFIIRAFTKLFAIPGLRLGYGLGSRELVKKMWERKMPWSINSFACAIGKAIFEETDYLSKTSTWIRVETQWLYEELVLMPDFKVFKPDTNFILIKILNDTLNVEVLGQRMARKGILVRNASNFKFLNDKFFRVAVKDRESNIKLLKALRECIS